MDTYVMRVWLPDRPGALGAVASRIGAVGADVTGIDILERDGGRAIDELIVEVPSSALLELLVGEVGQVDGVSVEEVRPAAEALRDPRLDALEAAAMLVAADDVPSLLEVLAEHATRDFRADWVAVVDLAAGEIVAARGGPPPAPWLLAFIEGSRASARVAAGHAGPDDLAWAPLAAAGHVLVIGRRGTPLRARERRQAAALARIADARAHELMRAGSRARHPSALG